MKYRIYLFIFFFCIYFDMFEAQTKVLVSATIRPLRLPVLTVLQNFACL